MTHTDTDIAEILERFDEITQCQTWVEVPVAKDFITRECLALKKKWEREHGDNQ